MRAELALVLLAASSALAQPRPATDAVIVEPGGGDEALARSAASFFAESRRAVEEKLGAPLGEPPPRLHVTASEAEFRKRVSELTGGPPPSWALAIALPSRRVVVLRADRLRSGDDFLAPTLRHEIAHLVLGAVSARSGQRIPRWLDEGLAQYAEGARLSRDEELELGAAARFGTLPTLATIERDFPPHAREAQRAYEMSLGFVHWLDERPGGVKALVASLERGSSAEEAIRALAGKPAGEAEAEWALDLAARSSVFESLLRSSAFWWGAVSLLALLAFARNAIVSRRMKRDMERRETLVDPQEPDDPPGA